MKLRGQRGFSSLELIGALMLLSITAALAFPSMREFHNRAETGSSATAVESWVRQVRMMALKERTSYRLLVHDESSVTPNRIELQRRESGSFSTIVSGAQFPDGVRILGSSPTDSIDTMTVGPRGYCEAGKVYVQGPNELLFVIKVEATCLTSVEG
ncbi:MAG: type II secretion system protein [bacterium]|nr:type II secretion system protein [bacterium]